MQIDNSQFTMYMRCPKMWWERYEAKYAAEALSINSRRGSGTSSNAPPVVAAPAATGELPAVVGTLGQAGEFPIFQPGGTLQGIELDEPSEGRDFGTRFHQLLHERRLRQLGVPALPA